MSHTFPHKDFLLGTQVARRLFFEVAQYLPVVDYHCHLSASDLAEDRRFSSLTELWIASDPYKHRAMRIAGVPEEEITGNASARTKFDRWTSVLAQTLGNPLHLWSAMELSHYFGVQTMLTPETADTVWKEIGEQLQSASGSARSLLKRGNAAVVCTSDKLCDDLSSHKRLAEDWPEVKVLPSLRADDLLAINTGALQDMLSHMGNPSDWCSFTQAVIRRLDAFDALGCRLADHGLDTLAFEPVDESETASLWERRSILHDADTIRLRSGLLLWLAGQYASRDWVMQLHLGALRNTSSRLSKRVGPAGGYAAIGATIDIKSLCGFLDTLEDSGRLPRTILYPLDPAQFAPLAVLTGSFPGDGQRGRLQLGPAWWYNDHVTAMRSHLDAISSHGLLSVFVGMTTDSRNLLSMSRHSLFRRVLCGWIGEQVASGLWPDSPELLNSLVADLSLHNALRFLRLKPLSHLTLYEMHRFLF